MDRLAVSRRGALTVAALRRRERPSPPEQAAQGGHAVAASWRVTARGRPRGSLWRASLIRLAGMLCIEQNDEWLVGRRYLSAAAIEPLLEKRLHREPNTDGEEVRELTAA